MKEKVREENMGFNNIIRKIVRKGKNEYIKFRLKNSKNKEIKEKKIEPRDIITDEYRKAINRYWSRYIKTTTDWHEWYTSRNGIEDVRYIPEVIFYNYILPYYNNKKLATAFSDKSYCSLFFEDVKRPTVIAKNINGLIFEDNFSSLTYEQMIIKCSKEKKLIIKPSIDSGGGNKIVFVESDNPTEMRDKVKKALEKFDCNFVIQKIIIQHEVLNKLNPTSINTVRVMSFLNKDGVNILAPHIRIGADNSEFDHNGIICGMSEEGVLQDYAVKYGIGDIVLEHPQGYEFKGVSIPGFEKMKEIVRNEHMKLGHFKLVSWDFAIDEQGEPLLIEVNLRYNGINHHQLTTGPLFGDLTESILEEVFVNK